MTSIDFPFLKVNQEFNSFTDFNILFQRLKNLHNIEYKHRSTKYCATDKKLIGKTFSPEILYSEFHVQCKKNGINTITGNVEECPSEIKLAPRNNYTVLKITVYNMTHNHNVTKVAEDDAQLERYQIIENITTNLASVLFEASEEEFTKNLDLLNNIIGKDCNSASLTSPLPCDSVETFLNETKNDVPETEVQGNNDEQNCSDTEFHIEEPHREAQLQPTNVSDGKKCTDVKSKRTIKKKVLFSPKVKSSKVSKEKPKKAKDKLKTMEERKTKGKKELDSEVSDECEKLINKYRQQFMDATDVSGTFSEKISVIELTDEAIQEKDVASTQTAFNDLNRQNKKIRMMKWLQIPDTAIKNSMDKEYTIQLKDMHDGNLSESFLEIHKNDLELLQKHFTKEAYSFLLKSIETNRSLGSKCFICKSGEEAGSSWILCEACLRWFHYGCVGIKKDPKKDWFCTKGCN